MRLTNKDKATRQKYDTAIPNFLGNLHERMKYVMQLAEKHYEELPQELWQALCDLRIEVSYHQPAKPPFGRRIIGT